MYTTTVDSVDAGLLSWATKVPELVAPDPAEVVLVIRTTLGIAEVEEAETCRGNFLDVISNESPDFVVV